MRIGILGLLLVAFILLKVLHVITWSWWIVLIPAYLMVALWIFFIAILIFAAIVKGLTE